MVSKIKYSKNIEKYLNLDILLCNTDIDMCSHSNELDKIKCYSLCSKYFLISIGALFVHQFLLTVIYLNFFPTIDINYLFFIINNINNSDLTLPVLEQYPLEYIHIFNILFPIGSFFTIFYFYIKETYNESKKIELSIFILFFSVICGVCNTAERTGLAVIDLVLFWGFLIYFIGASVFFLQYLRLNYKYLFKVSEIINSKQKIVNEKKIAIKNLTSEMLEIKDKILKDEDDIKFIISLQMDKNKSDSFFGEHTKSNYFVFNQIIYDLKEPYKNEDFVYNNIIKALSDKNKIKILNK